MLEGFAVNDTTMAIKNIVCSPLDLNSGDPLEKQLCSPSPSSLPQPPTPSIPQSPSRTAKYEDKRCEDLDCVACISLV